jgi:hypothetical protein
MMAVYVEMGGKIAIFKLKHRKGEKLYTDTTTKDNYFITNIKTIPY